MTTSALGPFTIPFSVSLIAFLAYGSQLLFCFIEPGPLRFREGLAFNGLVLAAYIGYLRSCYTNPGWIPKHWKGQKVQTGTGQAKTRWCKKCQASKPPRAHHCKACTRCIPKMDHHCPWTTSCISYRTFPHFCRFLLYSVLAMLFLSYLLYLRVMIIWDSRNLPSVGQDPSSQGETLLTQSVD